MGDQLQALDQVRTTAIDLGMKFGPKLVVAVLILVAGYVVGRWTGRAVGRMLGRFHLEPPVRLLLERGAKLLVVGLFAIMALQNLGVELLPLIAGLGVAGAGIALAAVEEVLRANARVLQDPRPGVAVARLADSRVAIGVNPWVRVPDYGAAASEINQAILETFRRRNIVIPLPQREVRMLAAAV